MVGSTEDKIGLKSVFSILSRFLSGDKTRNRDKIHSQFCCVGAYAKIGKIIYAIRIFFTICAYDAYIRTYARTFCVSTTLCLQSQCMYMKNEEIVTCVCTDTFKRMKIALKYAALLNYLSEIHILLFEVFNHKL